MRQGICCFCDGRFTHALIPHICAAGSAPGTHGRAPSRRVRWRPRGPHFAGARTWAPLTRLTQGGYGCHGLRSLCARQGPAPPRAARRPRRGRAARTAPAAARRTRPAPARLRRWPCRPAPPRRARARRRAAARSPRARRPRRSTPAARRAAACTALTAKGHVRKESLHLLQQLTCRAYQCMLFFPMGGRPRRDSSDGPMHVARAQSTRNRRMMTVRIPSSPTTATQACQHAE